MKIFYKYSNIFATLFVVLVLTAIFLGYQAYKFREEGNILKEELAKKGIELDNTNDTVSFLQESLNNVEKEKNKLKEDVNKEIAKTVFLQQKVKNIAGTVGVLEKLSQTDKELLQKYSKVYFLNENYIPNKLTQIDIKYTYDKNTDKWIHASVWPYLKRMLDDSKNSGMDLLIASAYRSFETQSQLKSNYSLTYGSGANKFSADQGYSEHQLGTTVDFTTSGTGDNFPAFKNTDEYKWLTDNAYKYGFTLSYPEKNGYYVFEPWHWRFVGVKLATRLHDDGIYFYDLSQREIDEYLVNIFD